MLAQGTSTWLTTFSTFPPSETVRSTSKTRPTASECRTGQLWWLVSRVAISLSFTPTIRPVWLILVLLVSSVVVLEAQVGDEVLALHVAQGVLQLHELDEQVVLGVEAGGGHGTLEVERQPLLDPAHPRAGREVAEDREVQDDGGREDRVTAQEVHLDLHRVAHPPEDVDVVPAFLVVPPGRVVVDPHLVVHLAVQLGIELRLQG